jgi:hypothetical protein
MEDNQFIYQFESSQLDQSFVCLGMVSTEPKSKTVQLLIFLLKNEGKTSEGGGNAGYGVGRSIG